MVETTSQIIIYILYIYFCIHHQYIYIYILEKNKNVPRKTGIYPLILQRPSFFSGQACDADPTVLGGHPTCRGEPKAAKVSDFYAAKIDSSMFLMGYNDQKSRFTIDIVDLPSIWMSHHIFFHLYGCLIISPWD